MIHRCCGGLLLALGMSLLMGCASPWEKHFVADEPLPEASLAPIPPAEVEVRSLPHERLRHFDQAERARKVQSTTAPADYTPQQQLEAKNRLLEALQVQARGSQVAVLGWSSFYAIDEPDQKALRKYAGKLGADMVVVSATPAGQVTTIQQEPVTSHTDGWVAPLRTRGGRGGRGYFYSDRSTTWVPVPVTQNQTYYEAFFLRHANGPSR